MKWVDIILVETSKGWERAIYVSGPEKCPMGGNAMLIKALREWECCRVEWFSEWKEIGDE